MPALWRRRHWPPSPFVEDEVDALAHEVPTAATKHLKTDDEARSRGTVDQYPIILDIDQSKTESVGSTDRQQPPPFDSSSVASQSSEDSHGPSTPRNVRFTFDAKRGNVIQRPRVKEKDLESREKKVDCKADKLGGPLRESKDEKPEERPRGRPNVAKIDTGLGGDLQGMISGRRRAPSPYSFTKPDLEKEGKPDNKKHHSGDLFLSPDATTPKQHITIPEAKRSSSTRPRERDDEHDPSTDSEHRRNLHRHQHHSRRRSGRESLSGRDASPEREHLEIGGHHSVKHRDRSRQRSNTDFPVTTRRDDHHTHRHHRHSHHERIEGKSESSQSSSTENTHGKSKNNDRLLVEEGARPRRHSRSSSKRPILDPSLSRYTFDGADVIEKKDDGLRYRKDRVAESNAKLSADQLSRKQTSEATPVSLKAVEDYFDNAIRHNKRSTNPSPRPSPMASPRESPTHSPNHTPPRTPRATDRLSTEGHLHDLSNLGQRGLTNPRAPSRTNSIEIPQGIMSSSQKSVKPSSLLSKSSKPSEAHSGAVGDFNTNVTKSKYASPLPSPVDNPPLQRAGSYVFPSDRGAPSAQRSFSYSHNDSHRPSSDETYRNNQYRRSEAPSTPTSGSAPAPPRLTRSSAHSSQEKVPRVPPASPTALDLPACPRSTPTAGYHDWYTISGLNQLNICPTCMKAIGNSRFRDLFIPSLSKGRDEKVSCTLSDPWVRIAWAQTIKQRKSNLDMLHQVLYEPQRTRPCPGKALETRSWFRLIDPKSGDSVHGFTVCSACVRRLDVVFPQLQDLFQRNSDLIQERKCDLEYTSHRFHRYVELLDAAALECDTKHLSTPDVSTFVKHADRMAQLRECNRDNMVLAAGWHFHPDLPELTICEECYNSFVWPLRDRPIARDVTRSPCLVPGRRQHEGLSCQLYSKRMRTKFEEAIYHHDFQLLKESATRRYKAERHLQERQALLLEDLKKGYDRHSELENNVKLWKQIE
ncbi:MAG: hypothetical protein Q9160_001638 [Pyrenula sp. 1 TL-2023]